MVELSNERIEEILHKETQKPEDLTMILRAIYTRYMHLYEKYFADIDALNDDEIAGMKKYNEETKSLVKYYHMDIPQDICIDLAEFEKSYGDKLLGANWHKYLFNSYDGFKSENECQYKSEKLLKKKYSEQALEGFYEAMDYCLREGFGTASKNAEEAADSITGLLFGE